LNRQRTVLRAVAVLFVAGGTVRMLANQAVFSLAGIGELWVDAPYFVYVYRVLGAFVVLTGLYLWSLAVEGGAARHGVRAVEWGLGLAAVVMLVTGWHTGLPARFYVVDVVFCVGVVFLLEWVRRRARSGPRERGRSRE
jgi:hypothetical protein